MYRDQNRQREILSVVPGYYVGRAAFPFHLIILKNDPWPTKAAITCTNDGEKSLALPCRNHRRQQDYGFFSIFDEYRRNECGIESFH